MKLIQVGDVFGRLTIVGPPVKQGPHYYYDCKCDCGKEKTVRRSHLLSGGSASCGCLRLERIIEANTRHGGLSDPNLRRVHNIWTTMKQRCLNPNHRQASCYSERGISIQPSWEAFENFLEAMGVPPTDTASIERVDNNEGYYKWNCKWATAKEQANNRRSNRLIEFNGKIQSVALWADELGIEPDTIRKRLNMGWPVEQALTKQVA